MVRNRSFIVLILGTVIALLPSVAHAHGFPWWFGLMVLSPFLLLAVLIAIPCKSAILRFAVLKDNQSLSFKLAIILMLLDLGVLFFSIWVYGIANSPIRDYIFYNLIDPSMGWEHRAMYQKTYERIVAVFMGLIMTICCAAISWFPYYGILKKRVSELTENPPLVENGLLLLWAFVLSCVGPGIFWFPACLRFM
jgi:hypothetical protein